MSARNRVTSIWMSAESSATSTCSPLRGGIPRGAMTAVSRRSSTGSAARATGSMSANIEPWPRVLCTLSSPPSTVVRRRQIARPSPLPPKRRVVEESACSKSANTRAASSGVMPMPVSRTSTRSRGSFPRPSSDSATVTPPRSVNLIALPIRFSRIWRIRVGSDSIQRGSSDPSICNDSASPLLCARLRSSAQTSCAICCGEQAIASMVSLPASILVMSRMSLTMASRCSPLRRMMRAIAVAADDARDLAPVVGL